MDDIHRQLLKVLDEYVAARQRTNSPADILAAIERPMAEIIAQHEDIRKKVHGTSTPAPRAASHRQAHE